MKKLIFLALLAVSLNAKAQVIHSDTASDMVYVDITPELNKSYDEDSVTTLWIGVIEDHHSWLICYWELRSRIGNVMDKGNFKRTYSNSWSLSWVFDQLSNYVQKDMK